MAGESDELKALRNELASYKATADRLRNQLSDAKTRAKEVIQRQRREAEERTSVLEEDLRMRSDELNQVKALLRLADDEKEGLSSEAVVLKDELRGLTERVKAAGAERDAQVEISQRAEKAARDATAERDRLNDEMAILRKELETARASASTVTDSNTAAVTATTSALSSETQSVADSSEVSDGPKVDGTEGPGQDDSSAVPKEQLVRAHEREATLSKQLDTVKEQLRDSNQKQESALAEARARNKDVTESLTKAEATISELKSNLERSEATLREERARRSAISAGEKEEAEKVLTAKVAEMERLVASKQAEIGRVREKARTYLKELNAEKREMEEKNKQAVDLLQKKLDEEREKVSAADLRAEGAAKEIDNCLAVIRDKQKSVQMLTMTVSTLKSNATEAERQMEALRAEFVRYKERARLALEEKDNSSQTHDAGIEAATANLRAELERARKSSSELRKQALRAREMETLLEEMRERAERAEAAADLLRSDANGVSTTNINQVDRLEERIATLEGELVAERSNVENAELRHATTKMRLEAADKALRAAEVRANESEKALNKKIQSLREEVRSLQEQLQKAKHSAECAQRTAAAAAKALTFSPGEVDEGGRRAKEHPEDTVLSRRSEEDRVSLNGTASGTRIPRDSGSSYDFGAREGSDGLSSFARAMEDESGRLGLSPRRTSESARTSVDGAPEASPEELKAREQQIVVLTAQVAELGMLLDDVQQESQLRAEQTALLKEEVKNLDAKLAAAEKLKNGAPFSYLRTIVVRYLETEDITLLPVICNVLSFTDDEKDRIKALRGGKPGNPSPKSTGYFSLPFLGS